MTAAVASLGDEIVELPATDFDVWYQTAYPRVVGAIHLACGNRDVAEDTAAEAFTRACERWRRVSTMESPTGWVLTVAINLWKRRQRRAAVENALLRRSPSARHRDVADVRPEIWAAVAALAPQARTAVALRYVADLTEAGVAEVMGVAVGTASATLAAARKRLAEQLGADHE